MNSQPITNTVKCLLGAKIMSITRINLIVIGAKDKEVVLYVPATLASPVSWPHGMWLYIFTYNLKSVKIPENRETGLGKKKSIYSLVK